VRRSDIRDGRIRVGRPTTGSRTPAAIPEAQPFAAESDGMLRFSEFRRAHRLTHPPGETPLPDNVDALFPQRVAQRRARNSSAGSITV
jgi:hypothetical protein